MLFDMGILVTPEEYISKEEYDKIVKIFNDKISSLPIEDISCLRGKILQVKETKFTIPEIDEVKYQDRGYIFLILLKNIIKRHPKYEEEILGLGLKGNISRK